MQPINILGDMTPGNAAMGGTSALVLAANGSRNYALITNDSDVIIYLGLGFTAVDNKGIRLAVGGSYKIDLSNLFRGAIYGIAISGSSKVVATSESSARE